jgi:hypothetical protein
MSHRHLSQGGMIEHQALRQELQSRHLHEMEQTEESAELHTDLKGVVKPYITIARLCGCPAVSVAETLAGRLGWTTYDHQIVEEISRSSGVFHTEVEALDGKVNTQLRDYIASLPFMRLFSQETYLHYLHLAVVNLARKSNAIFIDRGANFILPESQGIRLLLTAPLSERLAVISSYRELSTRAAREYLEAHDAEQAAFISYHFSHDLEDPHAYDAILDLSRLTVGEVLDTTLGLLQKKLGVMPLRPLTIRAP